MEKIKRQFTFSNLIQFVKLQLAGNILFWGTYIGFFLLHEIALWPEFAALATASIIAHILFFIADSEWVFDEKGQRRKTPGELIRFIIFMGINYFINLGIIAGLSHYFAITPYIGQFVAALFFTFWTFIGLKYWVFRKPRVKSRKGASRGGRKSSK
jgi:putative flippase GtrA